MHVQFNSQSLMEPHEDLQNSFIVQISFFQYFPSQSLFVSSSPKSALCLLCSVRPLCSAWILHTCTEVLHMPVKEIRDNHSAYLTVTNYCPLYENSCFIYFITVFLAINGKRASLISFYHFLIAKKLGNFLYCHDLLVEWSYNLISKPVHF